MTQFRDLNVGDTFDFVGARGRFNSFFERCTKVSARKYAYADDASITVCVGSINATVFHEETDAMTKPNKLEAGDRVAYAAKFLKDTGQFTGAGPQRRGTFLSYWARNGLPSTVRIRWDDFEDNASYYAQQYGDDYLADAREHGQCALACNIAKVGSPRFALNCM